MLIMFAFQTWMLVTWVCSFPEVIKLYTRVHCLCVLYCNRKLN